LIVVSGVRRSCDTAASIASFERLDASSDCARCVVASRRARSAPSAWARYSSSAATTLVIRKAASTNQSSGFAISRVLYGGRKK
jgi:hypothetical protein